MKVLLQSLRSVCLRIENRLTAQIVRLQGSLDAVRDAAHAALTHAVSAQKALNSKMEQRDPVGYGSFSMGRKEGTPVGDCSHAEGSETTANGYVSHAEGYNTTASGNCSHAEGNETTANGYVSHAEGSFTEAYGDQSHAEGGNTKAARRSQHVEGEYNIAETSVSYLRGEYVHIVGNGTSDSARSNAHTLDWEGNAWFAGDVYVGSTSGTNRDDGSKKLVTEDSIPTALPNPHKLTLTGAAKAEYDGSAAVSVEIPAGGGGDSSLGITGASVGQTVKITEVDDNGRPTAWEAVEAHPEFELIGTIDCTDASYNSFRRTIDISAYRRVWVYGNQLSTPNSASILSGLNDVSLDYIAVGTDESTNKTNFVILLDGTGPYAAAYRIAGTGRYAMIPNVTYAVNNPANAGVTAIGTGLHTLVLTLSASAWSLSGGTIEIWGERG